MSYLICKILLKYTINFQKQTIKTTFPNLPKTANHSTENFVILNPNVKPRTTDNGIKRNFRAALNIDITMTKVSTKSYLH